MSVDNGTIVDAALAWLDRDLHETVASLRAHPSLEEMSCRAWEPAVNGGKPPAMHHIGPSDENDYTRSGGHLGLTCDAAGACAEEPVLTGNDTLGVPDYSDSDNGMAVYDPVDATMLMVDMLMASVLHKVECRIGTNEALVTAVNGHGDGWIAHAGRCSGC